MAPRKTQGSNAGLYLGIAMLGATLWGAERWRGHAARRAGTSERSRATALARCVFGQDALSVLRSPADARARLRQLALATPAEPSITWLDRCVPMARVLAAHASEVDYTRRVTDAPSHLRENTRKLLREIDRTALVWRVRAGDPATDVTPLVDAFVKVTTELDLSASGGGPADSLDSPEAPVARPLAVGTLVPTLGLEPTSIGTPTSFFAGAPMPGMVSVSLEGGQWTVRTLATASAHAWVIRPGAVLRVDARSGPTDDGLTDLRWIRPGLGTEHVRVAPIDEPADGVHVDIDGYLAETGAFWLAQWTPALGVVFGRHSPRRGWASFTLANNLPEVALRARHPVHGRTRIDDEHVAVSPLGHGAVAAYTTRARDHSTVSLAATVNDTDQPQVVRLGETRIAGRTPDVLFCPRPSGRPWLFIGGAREWAVLEVDADGAHERLRAPAPRGAAYAERVTVRCEPDFAVMYAAEGGRSSPVVHCDDARCRAIAAPEVRLPTTLPAYLTRAPNGRAIIHGEWPTATALAGSTLVFARAAGSVVAVSLRGPRATAWDPERVVFDAASHTPGAVIEGLGLYAHGDALTLALTVSDGLRILTSRDRGASWE